MSITPPENGTPGTTPLYDETIAAPTYEDLRVPADDGYTTGQDQSGSGGAKERAQQTAGAAKGAASDVAGTAKGAASDVAGTAKGAATDVASTAKDAGHKVAATGKEQASKVAKDALSQARELYGQATSQLSDQAGTQQQKAAGTLHTFADDLTSMRGQQDGLAAELLENIGGRAKGVAEWLENRDPQDVLVEVKRFAANRPWLFIGLAAGAGIVAGRLSKALVAEAKDDAQPQTGATSGYTGTTGYSGLTAPEPSTGYTTGYTAPPASYGDTAIGGTGYDGGTLGGTR
jgi:hypothetical protein